MHHHHQQHLRARCNSSDDHQSITTSSLSPPTSPKHRHTANNLHANHHHHPVIAIDVGDETNDKDEKYTKRNNQRKKEETWMIVVSIVLVLCACPVIFIMLMSSDQPQLQGGNNIGSAGSSASAAASQRRMDSSTGTDTGMGSNRRIGNAVDNISKSLLRGSGGSGSGTNSYHPILKKKTDEYLQGLLQNLDNSMIQNEHSGIKWMNPELLLSLDKDKPNPLLLPRKADERRRNNKNKYSHHGVFFRVSRLRLDTMKWEREYNEKKKLKEESKNGVSSGGRPKIDYTNKELYKLPSIELKPKLDGSYPKLKSLKQLMIDWPQDNIDNPPSSDEGRIEEVLQHFNYLNETELNAAIQYREHKLPFKVYNVPELLEANKKWTDDYISDQFDNKYPDGGETKRAQGTCQESSTNFFAFYTPNIWDVELLGIPPTRNNDYTYLKWSQHATYADDVGLDFDQPHYYWQAGVPREERLIPSSQQQQQQQQQQPQQTFISRDLPSFSSPDETFFVFSPDDQKGIQCRFGERGVTAATHFDSGRNVSTVINYPN